MEPIKNNSKSSVYAFLKHNALLELPNLIEVQVRSYNEFLQYEILPSERKSVGLQQVFEEIFPIKSFDENISLEFVSYNLGVPKYTPTNVQDVV